MNKVALCKSLFLLIAVSLYMDGCTHITLKKTTSEEVVDTVHEYSKPIGKASFSLNCEQHNVKYLDCRISQNYSCLKRSFEVIETKTVTEKLEALKVDS